ncbi:uncharacterized protein (TIGR04255 family) [Azomonas agilis]|uniref:Uncharacterized protein (TIGR04255 family) n=1 Tax=Azomonas agilis TaxID=116849 RepID=A0A562HYG7_9GAMM|nr:TIGR04255 family protein [Azomonas agilis]TWH63819.1 uncharacterized protein (TIGR04255 family) [Azomonas agilis]
MNLIIVVNGKFESIKFSESNLKMLSEEFISKYLIFPMEATEQRIEFSDRNSQPTVQIEKLIEFSSANKKSVFRVRPDAITYQTSIDNIDNCNEIITKFSSMLSDLKDTIKFKAAERLGVVISKDISDFPSEEDAKKIFEINDQSIIEYKNRVAHRITMEGFSEEFNFAIANDYISTRAGIKNCVVNISYDVNTLASNKKERFDLDQISFFVNSVIIYIRSKI